VTDRLGVDLPHFKAVCLASVSSSVEGEGVVPELFLRITSDLSRIKGQRRSTMASRRLQPEGERVQEKSTKQQGAEAPAQKLQCLPLVHAALRWEGGPATSHNVMGPF